MVFLSATVELKVNVATPFALLVADAGSIVLPLPVELRVTDVLATGPPLAFLTVTVMVLLAPVRILLGAASIVDWVALGPADLQVMVNVTSDV
jgi:hypothetical protein